MENSLIVGHQIGDYTDFISLILDVWAQSEFRDSVCWMLKNIYILKETCFVGANSYSSAFRRFHNNVLLLSIFIISPEYGNKTNKTHGVTECERIRKGMILLIIKKQFNTKHEEDSR